MSIIKTTGTTGSDGSLTLTLPLESIVMEESLADGN